jgi:hypothetical protein
MEPLDAHLPVTDCWQYLQVRAGVGACVVIAVAAAGVVVVVV